MDNKLIVVTLFIAAVLLLLVFHPAGFLSFLSEPDLDILKTVGWPYSPQSKQWLLDRGWDGSHGGVFRIIAQIEKERGTVFLDNVCLTANSTNCLMYRRDQERMRKALIEERKRLEGR